MKDYNRDNIKLAKALRENMTPWERKLWYDFFRIILLDFKDKKLSVIL